MDTKIQKALEGFNKNFDQLASFENKPELITQESKENEAQIS